jgi:hypothetical protein
MRELSWRRRRWTQRQADFTATIARRTQLLSGCARPEKNRRPPPLGARPPPAGRNSSLLEVVYCSHATTTHTHIHTIYPRLPLSPASAPPVNWPHSKLAERILNTPDGRSQLGRGDTATSLRARLWARQRRPPWCWPAGRPAGCRRRTKATSGFVEAPICSRAARPPVECAKAARTQIGGACSCE